MEPLWYYSAVEPFPANPIVPIWNGSTSNGTEFDPAFLGESLLAIGASVPAGYIDCRLLPGSPLMDKGRLASSNDFTNGESYVATACGEVGFFDWDGEGHGNSRIAGDFPDIGFDEVHLFSMAGSYGNYTNSHNDPPGGSVLNQAATQGQAKRYGVFPRFVPGPTPQVDLMNTYEFWLYGVERGASAPAVGWGWVNPPTTTLTATQESGAIPRWDRRWISDSIPLQSQTVLTWNGSASSTPTMEFVISNAQTRNFFSGPAVTGQSQISFLLTEFPTLSDGWTVDQEPSPYAAWFTTEFKIRPIGQPEAPYYISNIQTEYR